MSDQGTGNVARCRTDGADRWEAFMRIALEEARKARDIDEIPVGAVVVRGGEVFSRAHNRQRADCDPTAHAEVLALRRASERIGSARLDGCDLVTTLEPCPMCAGALMHARIRRVIFGAADAAEGCCGSLYDFPGDPALRQRAECVGGVLEGECAGLIRGYMADKRRKGGVDGAALS